MLENDNLNFAGLPYFYENMKRYILTIISLLALWSCGSDNNVKNDTIVVSIEPLAYFVETIAGDDFKVTAIIPSNASAENYEPTADNIKNAVTSKLFVGIGLLDNERNIIRMLESDSSVNIVNLSESVELIEGDCASGEHHGHSHGTDPHIWLSLENGKIIARKITDALCKLKPEMDGQYRQNCDSLTARIDSLSTAVKAKAETKGTTDVFIYHPALAYLAAECGFEQTAIEKDGKEPSASGIRNLIEKGRKNGVKHIFYQSHLNSESVKTIAEETGATPTELNPLEKEWFSNIEKILNQIYE